MKPHSFVSLSDCCQGCFGIVDMPKFVERAIRIAYRIQPSMPPTAPPTFEQYLTGKTFTDSDLVHLHSFSPLYEPQPYFSLDVSHIRIRHAAILNQHLKETDVRLVDGLESAYHPVGRGVAFTMFQFIYHEKNVHLAEPSLIWSILHSRRFECTANWRKYYFALLLQLLGLRMDILLFGKIPGERPHYRTNIVERPGLTTTQREERTRLFTSAVDWLFVETIKELQSA